MIDSGNFNAKKILLIDKDQKTRNDRTWCFWETGDGYFQNIVYKKWQGLKFISDAINLDLDIVPYEYKMIRGIDFYNYCFNLILTQKNIVREFGEVLFNDNKTTIFLNGKQLNLTDATIFNSIYIPAVQINGFNLKQHFKGWIIETDQQIFDPEKAILMDFRVDQSAGTTFVYVLPITDQKALIEYTVFSESTLSKEDYDRFLSDYISNHLGITQFKKIEEEIGVIPMTSQLFPLYKNGMYNIGTAGGQTKASTGYTFNFIQKQASTIVQRLLEGHQPFKYHPTSRRFSFYDNTLLHILSERKLSGKQIFEQLFTSNKATSVFRFLDNETSVGEELRIINSLPKKVFIQAGIKEFFKMIFSVNFL